MLKKVILWQSSRKDKGTRKLDVFMYCVQVIALLHYATDIIIVCSEILFSEGLCCAEANHFICDANRLTGFCMERSFTRKCYRTEHNLFLFTYFLVCFFFSGKLEIDLTYVTSFFSEHICTRCYYLYYLTLLGLAGIYQFVNQGKPTFKNVLKINK